MKIVNIINWKTGKIIFSYKCKRNNIRKTVMKCINLGIDLSYANLNGANLDDINFNHIKLSHANLSFSSLSRANLSRCDLSYANLANSFITSCNLGYANLSYANLYRASLDHTDLCSTNITGVKGINDQCPKEGSFIGWKKCILNNGRTCIVKLEIPADAKRSSGTGIKCRSDKAKVLEIQYKNIILPKIITKFLLPIAYSYYNPYFKYKVGEIVKSDSFDERYWNECSHGIHFFMNREDAVNF